MKEKHTPQRYYVQTVDPPTSEYGNSTVWLRKSPAGGEASIAVPGTTEFVKAAYVDDLRSSHDVLVELVEELRNDFINIVVGGCTCGTKPPDPALHELNCHYRMAETGLARIETHRAALKAAKGDL